MQRTTAPCATRYSTGYLCGLLLLLTVASMGAAKAEIVDDSSPWDILKWVTIEPGVGVRKASLFIEDSATFDQASISTHDSSIIYWSLNIGTPDYKLGNSGFGISLNSHSSYIEMDHQWFDFLVTNPEEGEITGEPRSLGTRISGTYSYIMPMLSFKVGGNNFNMKASAGYGVWIARLSGDIILSPNKQPNPSMPITPVSTKVEKLAPMFQISFGFPRNWSMFMTMGGPIWNDSQYNYDLQELNMAISKTISF